MQLSMSKSADVKAIFHFVCRVVHGMVASFDDADDLAQDIMLKLITSTSVPPRFSYGWIYRVAQRAVFDARRRNTCEAKYLNRTLFVDFAGVVREDDEFQGTVYSARTAEAEESDVSSAVAVQAALAKMPAALRQTLVLYANGASYDQIATATGTCIGTVRSRLHYARKRARQLIEVVA